QGAFQNTIEQIHEIWNTLSPGVAFDYRFMDDSFNEVYQNEQRLGKIFIIFTALSIFIACLGLFGLAAFNAQKRIKEIGVRKVLGASVSQITYRLSFDFLKLVGISILIALPVGWFAMDRWLQDFTYRIDIGLGTFLIAAILAIVIALLTVSYQSIKAAIVNPVKSLRTE
ncbi:MAG: FtsX-like permease family protein, partial [Bacteroidota bacterium]